MSAALGQNPARELRSTRKSSGENGNESKTKAPGVLKEVRAGRKKALVQAIHFNWYYGHSREHWEGGQAVEMGCMGQPGEPWDKKIEKKNPGQR
mmetsp:Transcript_13969/g.23983  ORF Transcript_13969/g.23983 Transcript_13969/m.23983 type:complete len:94 (+) Transcript_13969:1-282(+)